MFGSLLRKAHRDRSLHGISITRNSPSVSHLFFADDSVIFARASVGDATTIKDILHSYEHLSGQKINFEKCEISFSKGLCRQRRDSIRSLLDMREVQRHDKYLGLPTIFDRSKKISLSGIRDRIWKKLQGWKEKLLSRAGKEVLIKSIINSIPSYAMSCFKLPSAFFSEVRSITRSFWWDSHQMKGIPWKARSFLCRLKEEGGMGFRDLEAFNWALLAKQL